MRKVNIVHEIPARFAARFLSDFGSSVAISDTSLKERLRRILALIVTISHAVQRSRWRKKEGL